MLKHLHIENIALVDTADLDFDKGMLVLTGETGAGKSIIVTALALALGSRAEREYIRHGEDRATVTATFGVSQMPAAYRKQFADCIVDGSITVMREISRDGNSRVRVNDTASSLGKLRDIVSPSRRSSASTRIRCSWMRRIISASSTALGHWRNSGKK